MTMSAELAAIPFPNLDPVIVHLGPLALRWYGLAYLLGFLFAYVGLRRLAQRGVLKLSVPDVSDLLTWLIAGVVIGGRAGWWLFYHRSLGDVEAWYEPLAIWHGGMSFHGGLLGVICALVIWSRRRHAPLWNIADAAARVAPIGLFFGRVANFINTELVGRPTGAPWAVIFPGDAMPRHPSQIYEALLEGPLLLMLLWIVRKLFLPAEGRTAALFLLFYGIFRFAVEFTREPDWQLGFIAFGWLTMGQLLSALLSLTGLALLLTRDRVNKCASSVASTAPRILNSDRTIHGVG